MRNKNYINLLVIFVFSLLSFTFLNKEASALPIGPDKYFVDISSDEVVNFNQDPGKDNQALIIYGQEQLADVRKVYISAVSMKKIGEENEREFFNPNTSDPTEPANWIQLSQTEAEISAGQTVIIPWKLSPSLSARCGTNLAAIMISNTPPEFNDTNDQETKISITTQIISQVHVNINQTQGDNCENNGSKVVLKEYKVDKFPLFNHPNVPLVVKLENQGNLIAQDPVGFIEIFGFGGKKGTIDFNSEKLDIYPGTTRKFNINWTDENYPEDGNVISKLIYEITHPKFGRYEARLGIKVADGVPQIQESVYFWIIPWKLILIILILVGGVGYFVLRTMKTEKKLKRLQGK